MRNLSKYLSAALLLIGTLFVTTASTHFMYRPEVPQELLKK